MPLQFTQLPFEEAIRFMRDKVRLPTRDWRGIERGMHSRAFVVAGAMKSELLADFHEEVTKAIANGTTVADFKKQFNSIVQKHGWTYQGKPGWRAALIYNTNMRTAHAAGAEAQMQRTKARRPYARYIAGLSVEPRPEHLEWHNTVLPLDHPWWHTHTPPNDWGCKCKKVSVSKREAERDGLQILDDAPRNGTYKWKDPRTGKEHTFPSGIGKFWDYNPGRAAWGQVETKRLADGAATAKWKSLDDRGPDDWDRSAVVPVDAVKKSEGPHAKKTGDVRTLLRDAVGGDDVTFKDPYGDFVNVNQGIADHILEAPDKRVDGRERFFPMIQETIEDPYEIWVQFARNESTGKVELRKRYAKMVHLDKKRTLGLIAQVHNGKWIGFDFFRGSKSAMKRLRAGMLIWGRE
ncbi:MAG: hypothetical protein G3M70_07250 [Candidatus Nitronauta litoralis]|uniref:Phage Mu protein F like protein n=1 Tax=Candidatus Nitronauta litoralis TaxID=2705533 RepID=A0A7T0BVI0_9BACT|nr:MAG: hypothetical protein G3M70_07250 [Candidatus Nitronauta litoralis]